MNPVVSYIKQTLQGYYPDSELVPMAKLLLTQVFGMSVVELYAGKDTTFSVNERLFPLIHRKSSIFACI